MCLLFISFVLPLFLFLFVVSTFALLCSLCSCYVRVICRCVIVMCVRMYDTMWPCASSSRQSGAREVQRPGAMIIIVIVIITSISIISGITIISSTSSTSTSTCTSTSTSMSRSLRGAAPGRCAAGTQARRSSDLNLTLVL